MAAIINLVHFPTFISQVPQNKLCGDIFIVILLLNLDSHLKTWQIFIRKCLKKQVELSKNDFFSLSKLQQAEFIYLFIYLFCICFNDVLLFIGSITDLQCCVSFRCTAKWFSCLNHIIQITFHYRLLQDTEYSSLYYT